MAYETKIFHIISMTIERQMYVSNILMVFFPLLVMVLLFCGTYLSVDSLLESDAGGIPSEIFHEIAEICEWLLPVRDVFLKCVVALALVFGTMIFLSVFLSNYFLSRALFKRILEPLSLLESSVRRIQKGDLEHPLDYSRDDEFKNICSAMDLLFKKLKEAMIARQNDEQSRKELIAGIFSAARGIRLLLEKFRPKMVFLVAGLVLGSLYAIAYGPSSLKVPLAPLSLSTFSVSAFLAGIAALAGMEFAKKKMEKVE